jgi:hypothetical protein
MYEITLKPEVGDLLSQVSGQAVLCDSNGRVLGFFSPTPSHPQIEQLQLEPPLSIVDTQKLRSDQTGKPLSEILSRLGIP